jgi:uncharacterized protein
VNASGDRARLPAAAAWRHRDAREGFEVSFVNELADGHGFEGECVAIEAGAPWAVRYEIVVDGDWITRRAVVTSLAPSGRRRVSLEHDGVGRWLVDGAPSRRLDGCLDMDLEASVCTNAFPVNRLELKVGESAQAPAAWVRVLDLTVEPLMQRYHRLEDDGRATHYGYEAPELEFSTELSYDAAGLVSDYPGLAVRTL